MQDCGKKQNKNLMLTMNARSILVYWRKKIDQCCGNISLLFLCLQHIHPFFVPKKYVILSHLVMITTTYINSNYIFLKEILSFISCDEFNPNLFKQSSHFLQLLSKTLNA